MVSGFGLVSCFVSITFFAVGCSLGLCVNLPFVNVLPPFDQRKMAARKARVRARRTRLRDGYSAQDAGIAARRTRESRRRQGIRRRRGRDRKGKYPVYSYHFSFPCSIFWRIDRMTAISSSVSERFSKRCCMRGAKFFPASSSSSSKYFPWAFFFETVAV